MNNLGGHDLPSIVEAFDRIDHDRPTCFIAYTVKGYGLPIAGHKDNHAGLMTPAQMESFRAAMNIRPGHEWDRFEGLATPPETLQAFLDRVPFAAGGPRRLKAPQIPVPAQLAVTIQPRCRRRSASARCSTSWRASKTALAERIVTTSPDVTVSTNLGPWVNRRGLFARETHGRHLQERAHPVDLQLGVLAQGPAHRARHRRDEPVHPAVRARPVALDQRRAAACRSARCTIRSSRAASMR